MKRKNFRLENKSNFFEFFFQLRAKMKIYTMRKRERDIERVRNLEIETDR